MELAGNIFRQNITRHIDKLCDNVYNNFMFWQTRLVE